MLPVILGSFNKRGCLNGQPLLVETADTPSGGLQSGQNAVQYRGEIAKQRAHRSTGIQQVGHIAEQIPKQVSGSGEISNRLTTECAVGEQNFNGIL
jgi:hypothetical protein